jgi:hypothetical protein
MHAGNGNGTGSQHLPGNKQKRRSCGAAFLFVARQ